MWVSEGHKLEETAVSDAELDAPLRASQHPPPHTKYVAHLQVRHTHATCFAERDHGGC